MLKKILIRIAFELEQGLTLVVHDLVFGKKARKGRKMTIYRDPKAPRARRVAYSRASTPRMVVVHIYEGAVVHF